MTSEQLSNIQKLLNKYLIKELKQPMVDFKLVRKTVKQIDLIDSTRRQTWHNEKFGQYEEFADKVLSDTEFSSDYIPF